MSVPKDLLEGLAVETNTDNTYSSHMNILDPIIEYKTRQLCGYQTISKSPISTNI